MNPSSGMKMQAEAPKEPRTSEIVKVTAQNFADYESGIMHLAHDALVNRTEDFTQREHKVQDLRTKYLEAPKRGELFVFANSEKKVEGFLALKKEEKDGGRVAIIDQVRLASGYQPRGILEELLKQAKASLEHEGVTRASITLEGDAYTYIQNFRTADWFSFFSVEKAEGGEEAHHLERAA